ncbi:forkhead-associated (FHA) domain-containing protein [Actinidia rufa]|uniref:Forkhead-associated (FHA) domain-containing protein n=1 Tax=Actinidia rufa TaxID=165716 RepID=A0A7J0EG90_9ERIC|nr:forkhead-associated (FHA) domain-containing protein [Actinidia rufa]
MPSFFCQSQVEESVNSSLPMGIVISRIEDRQFDYENQTPEPFSGTGLSGIENREIPSVQSEKNSSLTEILNSSLSDEGKDHQIAEVLQIVENHDPLLQPGPLPAESVNSSLPGGNVPSETASQQSNKANQSPRTPSATAGSQKENPQIPLMKSDQKSNLPSIWSRRGQLSSGLLIQTGRSRGKIKGADINAELELPHQEDIENNTISKALFRGLDGDEAFTPDKENFNPNTLIMRSIKNMDKGEQIKDSMSYRSSALKSKSTKKTLFTGSDGDEETFTPDKENFTPNTLLLRTMKKVSRLEEVKHTKLHRSSSRENAVYHDMPLEIILDGPSVKEKKTSKVLQERKSMRPSSRNQENSGPEVLARKSRAERVPFQPLLVNSSGKSKSEDSVSSFTMNRRNFVSYVQIIEKNDPIVGGNRRKALQLLQGLKGTQLIIPRIVIRELDCMKRRGSLFRRKTEVSYALQWIEECMVNTNWWIHVQSSEEEERPIAPTPPASPQSWFSEGKCLFFFEYVTLKIKALTEGLICETAQEFRESLVNPFSERFLWMDSSPRGPTWSCADDVVLREQFYSSPSRKLSKSGEHAKGLKLILLHNSRYAQTSVS